MKGLRSATVAACVAMFCSAAAAERLTFSISEARGVAREAFLANNYALANTLAHGLLAADPNDPTALILLAATEPLLGRPAEGQKAGAQAWRTSSSQTLRHEAAFYTARAAVFQKRFGSAQLWLRRAYQTSSTPAQHARVAQDFKRVRAVSPWTSRLSFSINPTNNLNGGSQSSFLVIDEFYPIGTLSGAAQALSGVRSSVEAELGYKISRGPNHQTALSVHGYHSFNYLSSEARTLAPGVEGSDFDYAVAEVALDHRLGKVPGPLPDSYSLTVGQTWYGGNELGRYVRLGVGRSFALSDQVSARVSVQTEQHWYNSGAPDSLGLDGNFKIARRFASGNTLGLSLGVTDVGSDSFNQAYTGWSAGFDFALGKPIGPVEISGSLGYRTKDFPAYLIGFFLIPTGREDEEIRAELNLRFRELNYMGFHPVVTFSGSHTTSNISRFENQSFGVSLGIRSTF